MDTGTILGYFAGYVAAMGGVALLYLPVIVLLVALLIAGGVLQVLLLPFIALFKRLRRRPETDLDPSWFLDRGR
ncbi:hypothetical protein [Arthrobacter sp. RC1.1 241]|uniref:hypothetical protein n=1 Tax=Paenarthrobacter sp. 22069 TaxID=3453864 RepID=UPI000D7CD925